MEKPTEVVKATTDSVIIRIKEYRDRRISFLLNEAEMMKFLEDHFDTIILSPIRVEFLKRDLIELKNSKLDLVHYSALIKELKEEPAKDIDVRFADQEIKKLYEKYRF